MASAPETNAVPGVPPHVLVVALQRAPRRPHDRSAPADAPAVTRAALARDALSAWETAGGPEQHFQRRLAAHAVLRCIGEKNRRKPSDTLDLSARHLGELPPFVETLSHLRILLLSECKLGEPPELGMFPLLLALAMRINRLETAPDLHAQTGLEELDLSYNFIAIPPILAQSEFLRRISFLANRLVVMPDVRNHLYLEEFDLRGNCLRTVPNWIRDLPRGLTIDLQGNPLSAGTIVALHELSLTGRGPTILFDRVYAESERPTSLDWEIDFWLHASQRISPWTAAELSALRLRWRDFAHEPDAGSFALLLNKLVDTADFQRSDATRHALLRRMPDLLAALARKNALRARCFELAEDGVGACEDRVALAFSKIQTAVLASACAGDRPKLIGLARAEFRLAHLDEIARNDKKARHGGTEEVEVVLAYRCHLTQALDLPCQPQGMLFRRYVSIGDKQLESAEHAVRSAEAMPGALAKFAAAQPFWRESLDVHPPFAQGVHVLRNLLLNRLEMLAQEGCTLTSHQYLERQAEINASHTRELDGLYERITAGIIRAHSIAAAPNGPTA